MTRTPKLGSRGKPEETRRDILEAAISEFAVEGVAGARTDSIAQSAGVNKALLYYYFSDKEALYGAVLDAVFTGLATELTAVLAADESCGRRILRYALTHFAYLVKHAEYGRLIQHEMMRAQTGKSQHVERIVHSYIKPILQQLGKVLSEGVRTREFRSVDLLQFAVSMTALNVFYFVSVPIQRAMGNPDPFSPAALKARCTSTLDMLSSTLFTDPDTGREISKSLLAEWKTPTRSASAAPQAAREPQSKGGRK